MKKRELITNGIDLKLLRIGHHELEKKKSDNWFIIPNVNEESQTGKNDYIEALKNSPSKLEACYI